MFSELLAFRKVLIYSICTRYLVGTPFALITASLRRGMEVISLWHCWGGMEAQASEIFQYYKIWCQNYNYVSYYISYYYCWEQATITIYYIMRLIKNVLLIILYTSFTWNVTCVFVCVSVRACICVCVCVFSSWEQQKPVIHLTAMILFSSHVGFEIVF